MEKTVWMLHYGPYVEAISVGKIVKATMEDHTLNKLAENIRIGYIDKKAADIKPYAKIFEQNTPPRETHYKSCLLYTSPSPRD